jgi:hypothetical protein
MATKKLQQRASGPATKSSAKKSYPTGRSQRCRQPSRKFHKASLALKACI